MSDTVEIALNDTTWTLIATGAAKGFITNEGVVKVRYREDTVLPTSDVGHTLEMAIGAYVSFNMLAGQNVYMKTVKGSSPIALTLE
jgi:hypothetical protein